jgi:hypothetical protein
VLFLEKKQNLKSACNFGQRESKEHIEKRAAISPYVITFIPGRRQWLAPWKPEVMETETAVMKSFWNVTP